MRLIKVATAALNQTPLDWVGNRVRISAALAEARTQGASILCLPELCITGYGCEDAFHAPSTHQLAWQSLVALLPETKGLVVSLGLPVEHGGALFNGCALAVDGTLLGIVPKRFLAADGIHYEPRWFKAWSMGVQDRLSSSLGDVPIGDIFFEVDDVRIGFEICEEAWVGDRPGASLAREGVDVILNPSASHFAFGKFETRKRFVTEGSRAFNAAYLYANLLGNESGRIIYDGGSLIASEGKLLCQGKRFGFVDYAVTTAVIDIDLNRLERTRRGSFQPRLGNEDTEAGDSPCIKSCFKLPTAKLAEKTTTAPSWERGSSVKEEEFLRAVALGLFDYLRKSRAEGFVVSLSGGVDSAVVATLSCFALELANAELGFAGLKERLKHLPFLPSIQDLPTLVRQCVQTAYQATANSSATTHDAAKQVAEELGVTFYSWDIEALCDGYKQLVAPTLGRPLDWASDDLALQNIQARVRGPSIWLLANLRRALLLATSNRSEAAVGYATMDGDTCGGLSPIAGIDKAFLRHWVVWLQNNAPEGLRAIRALSAVSALAPTAELKPKEAAQTDEKDLMPYDVLDAIERAAIRDKRSPVEIFTVLRGCFPAHQPADLKLWVARFFTLWCRNQWKRERYAPSFHLDDESLDPKTWCRFPILSSGYETELQALLALPNE